MDKIESQVVPVPPNLLISLRAGFDAVANQIIIILLPVCIDLLIWLGPHLQVKTMVQDFVTRLASTSGFDTGQTGELLSASMDVVNSAANQYNLLSLLRTIPVGIPSLMSSRLPVEIPKGAPLFIDITNPVILVGIVIGLLFVGTLLGSFYYLLVVQIAFQSKVDIKDILKNWPRAVIQVVSLSLALLILFITISIPSSCAISAVTLFGLPLGQFAIFLYIGVMLWLAFPLLFAAHGIFLNHNHALASVQKSMLLTKMTLPTTSLFIFVVLALSEGLDLLWRVPPENSWLTLVGVGGHAFITSALLAASFVYYRDADRWVQGTLQMINSQREMPLKGS